MLLPIGHPFGCDICKVFSPVCFFGGECWLSCLFLSFFWVKMSRWIQGVPRENKLVVSAGNVAR